MKYIVIAFIFVYCTEARHDIEKEACSITNPDYSKCVLDNLERLRPFLIKGIPELDFPPLDPLEIPAVNLTRKLTDLIKLQFTISKIKLTGMANTVIKELKVDPKNLSGEVKFVFPWLDASEDYHVIGQIVGPIQSYGYIKVNSSNAHFSIKGNAKFVENNTTKYLKLDKMSLKMHIESGKMILRSQHQGTQIIAALIEYVYNNYNRFVLDLFSSELTDTTANIMRIIIDRILKIAPGYL